jgi:bifunctional non-homologous end joining protein LigD
MALLEYRHKRNFKITSEPKGAVAKRKTIEGLSFVIQKHAASHLHYDFRLELNGVLLSWAVPKGPSLDPNDKRLAMHVEDHPVAYGSFEGTIPAHQYGGGTVLLWDRGVWVPKEDPVAGYKRGRLKFTLMGEKLHGGWILVKSHGGKFGGDKAWLLIKEDDEDAKRGPEARVVDEHPNSVATGRDLGEIAADQDRVWQSNRSVAANVKSGAVKGLAAAKKAGKKVVKAAVAAPALPKGNGAVKAPPPEMIDAQLALLVKAAPIGEDWIHEIKFDGYRMLTRIDHGKVTMFSRNGKNWTGNFTKIAEAVAELPVDTGWLDGEVVVLDDQGHSGFHALQDALSRGTQGQMFYYVFDLPYLNGVDLRQVPLLKRKELLEALIGGKADLIRYSSHMTGSGDAFFLQSCKHHLEGAIAKRAESPYSGNRNGDWVKVKCGMRQEVVIGGFTAPGGSRQNFGALLIGVYDDVGDLQFAGKVGTGFDQKMLASLRKKMDPLVQEDPPFVNPPTGAAARGVKWLKPKLVAEIAFTEWTPDGSLRHPSFQGLREDKSAAKVIREVPKEAPNADAGPRPTRQARFSRLGGEVASKALSGANIEGVSISNPTKILFSDAKLTKLDLAEYYEAVSQWMLPHLKDRPLSLLRCPNGWDKECFYQKQLDASAHPSIGKVEVQTSDGPATYMMANSPSALVGLLQMGVLEIHPWGSTKRRLHVPDRIIFDFDPDDGVAWVQIVEAVQMCRTLLTEIGLESFLKTTGGKGLHVVVPIKPQHPWPVIKSFSKAIADLFVQTFPDRFTAKLAKAARTGKIFIDYLRNDEGSTAIAPYSIRARKGAPVSMPIAWEELSKADMRFPYFNVKNAPSLLKKRRKDPWARFLSVKQGVGVSLLKKLGVST